MNIDTLLRRAFSGLHVATVGLVVGTQAVSCAKIAEKVIASRSGAIQERTLAVGPELTPIEAPSRAAERAGRVRPEPAPDLQLYLFEAPTGSTKTTD